MLEYVCLKSPLNREAMVQEGWHRRWRGVKKRKKKRISHRKHWKHRI